MQRVLFVLAVVFILWRLLATRSQRREVRDAGRDARRDAGPSRPRSPWEVLEVQPGASLDEIRAAYQTKVRQYHPDKVASLGPELQEVAERQTKEINAAYEALRQR